MTIKDRLKILRDEANITQEDLAKRLDVSKSAICNYEAGIRQPTPEIEESIADYFNVDLDYLRGRSDIKNRYNFETIAAHKNEQNMDDEEWTEEEAEEIKRFKDWIKSKRGE
jgi:transcriptional regulator with XRE-family HTH domain